MLLSVLLFRRHLSAPFAVQQFLFLLYLISWPRRLGRLFYLIDEDDDDDEEDDGPDRTSPPGHLSPTMSTYQGLPQQQSAPLYYDGLEVDVRPTGLATGLEAAPQPDHAGPQVVDSEIARHQPDHAGPQAVNYPGDPKHLASEHGVYFHNDPVSSSTSPSHGDSGQYAKLEHNAPGEAANAAAKKRKKRSIWTMVAVIVALVVVGAIVGGVVGGRAASKSSPAAALKNIMPNSRMAAIGWREGSTHHLRLYYQGPDQMLRYSNTTSGMPGWAGSVLLDSLRTPPRAKTSLAAAVDLSNASSVS